MFHGKDPTALIYSLSPYSNIAISAFNLIDYFLDDLLRLLIKNKMQQRTDRARTHCNALLDTESRNYPFQSIVLPRSVFVNVVISFH